MSKNKLTKRILLALSVGMLSLMPLASALPSQGAYDNSAAAAISTAGNTMSITGKNANNILNWLTFSVGKGETVRFTDKNNYLNLVNGFDISRIYGTISGGNNVYLVNPYGILFGQGATLDNVGSFVASTRDISDINKQAFLNDSSNVNGVLYTDYGESRNKDYFPDDSPYVPTISVAEINLTNVPASATKIVLDGPSGLVLKNTELLDKVTQVSTRVNGGEVGIGSSNANVNLTDAQKSKISLFLGGSRFNFDLNPSVIKSYKLVTNVSGLQAMTNGNYLLGNNIDASSISSFRPIEYSGIFDGLGYDVSNLKVNRTYSSDGSAGLFSTAYGTIRNLNLKEVNIAGGYSNGGLKAYIPPNYTTDAVGAVAAHFTGSMSNVHVTSTVEENDGEGVVDRYGGVHITRYGAVRGYDRVGGLVGWLGYDDSNSSGSKKSEIRNSSNGATVVLNGVNNAGGIIGTGQGYLFRVYNTGNINIGSTYADRYKTYYPEGIGGIAGSFGNNKGDRILSAYNTGRVFGGRFAAGIVGLPFAQIGDTYNLGEIVVNEYAYDAVGDIVGAVGTVKGNDWSYNIPTDLAYTSKETENKMPSYYISGKLMTFGDKPLPGVEFGNASSEDNVKDLLNKNWYGIGYPSTSGGDDGGNGDNSGGDSGSNTGGNSGGNGDPTKGGTGESTSGENDKGKNSGTDSKEYDETITVLMKDGSLVKTDVLDEEFPPDSKQWLNKVVQIEEMDDETRKQIFNKSLDVVNKYMDFDELLDTTEVLFKYGEKGLDSEGNALLNKFIIFYKDFQDVYKYKNGGLQGASDVNSLASSSIELWKGLYEYIGKMDNAQKTAFFKETNKDRVAALGIVSSSLGFMSSLIAATDGIENKRISDGVADYVDCLTEFVQMGKEADEFFLRGEIEMITDAGIVKTKDPLLMKDGLWTPLDVYVAIGEAGVRSGAQLIRSIGKYNADGKFDANDASETMIDTSMAGIKGLGHALSFGLDDLIYSKLDKTGGKVSYVEQAAEGYKMLARSIGDKIGNWWIGMTQK